ncbi:hypothetical protein MUP65_01395, partial [Patescibacteria group bacterium]|nr:hypothetical protein [Patescibacteria group bacterium]
SLLLVCLVGWGQFLVGHSFQGLIRWLGERKVGLGEPNIATVRLAGKTFLRPYATFSHPNNLAGFLVVSGGWFYLAGLTGLSGITLLIISTVLLTVSRPSIVVGLAYLFFNLSRLLSKSNLKKWFWPSGLSILLLSTFLLTTAQSFSLQRRSALNQCAGLLFERFGWFGIGLGQFIPHLSDCFDLGEIRRFWQPVHNGLVLAGLQLGLLFTVGLVGWLRREVGQMGSKPKKLLLMILFLNLWDHYWLTGVQTRYLLILILAWGWGSGQRGTISANEG